MEKTESRTKNTSRNIFFGLIYKLIILLFPFAIRTIIIYKLGADYVGVGSLFTSILQVLSVTELGFASAITFALYEPISRSETEKIKELISLLKTIYKIVGTIILVLGLILLPFIPYLIKGTPPEDINVYWLYIIYLSNTVISYLAFGYKNSILTAYQRYDIISKINIVIEIIKGSIQIVVLLISKNYYLYIITLPVFSFISSFIVHLISKKLYPELDVKTKFSLSGLGKIKKQLGGIAIGRISLVCRNSFDSIIISTILGLTMTAIYSNYYLIFTSVSSFLAIIIVSMAASVGNSLVTESIEKNEKDHMKFDFYFMVIVGLCTACLFGLYQPFMLLWVGENLMFPYHTMILFCIYFYINNLAQVRSAYSEAAGLWWHFRYFSILEMISNLVLNICLGIWIGIDGILLATIITAFLNSFIAVTFLTYKHLFKTKPIKYFLSNIFYAIVTFICCLCIYFLKNYLSSQGWGWLIINTIVCVTVSGIIMLICYMSNKITRKYIFDVFAKLKSIKQ